MKLRLFRINRRILLICKISLCVFCFSMIFYFDVPVYLLYNKIRSSKQNSVREEIFKPTPKFHRIHVESNDDEYRTFQSLEEERLQMKEFHRIYNEHIKTKRLDKLAKKWFREEYEGDFSANEYDDDDDDDDDDDNEYDEENSNYQYKSNDEEAAQVDSKEVEYQLKGEKLPSIVLPFGCLQLGRLYSFFHYFTGIIPETEKDPNGWPRHISRWTTDYINQYSDTSFAHFSKDICVFKKPLILIIVCSRPRNICLRQSIRNTWAKWADQYNITVLFLMGIPPDRSMEVKILEESNLQRDLILERFDDTYNNLTLKTIFMMKWVQMYCAEVPFVMKLDDDVYLNLENLYNYVRKIEHTDTSKLLVGKVEPNAKPYRQDSHKWYMPYYIHKPESYPNYTHGVGYLMSKEMVSLLYKHTLTKEFIHLEDVFLTGMCTQELNIKPIDQEEFRFLPEPKIGCGNELFPKLAIVAHHVKPLDMYKIHYSALNCSIIQIS